MVAMAQKKVAVYVTSDAPSVDNATQQIIGGELVAAIVKHGQFRAVERTADFLKQISKEQDYQHSGTVDDQQISALGKQFGVDFVCVASIMPYKKSYYLQARLIDVETATVQNIARETSNFSSLEEIMRVASTVATQLIGTAETSAKSTQLDTEVETLPSEKLVRLTKSERRYTGQKEFVLGETQMDSKELMVFFNKNCNRAYYKYYNGKNCIKAGWSLFGIGMLTLAGGVGIYCAADYIAENAYPYTSEEKRNYNGNFYLYEQYAGSFEDVAWSLIGVGSGCAFVSSAFLLPIGYAYRKSAINIYNERNCYRKQRIACTFNLQSSRDGFGLALTF